MINLRESKLQRISSLVLILAFLLASLGYYNSLKALEEQESQIQELRDVISDIENQNRTLEGELETIKQYGEELKKSVEEKTKENEDLRKLLDEKEKDIKRLLGREFTVTAYDLSVQSTGKPIGHPQYGVSRSGFNLSRLSRTDAKTIAVDPKVIPLGSKVRITFDSPAMQKYNGIYTARDTGGAIKGNKVDLFMGDFRSNKATQEVMAFGRQKARIEILGK